MLHSCHLVASDDEVISFALERCCKHADAVRRDFIVAVQKIYIVAAGVHYSCISGGGKPHVPSMPQNPELHGSAVSLYQAGGQCHASVLPAVVHDQTLYLSLICLPHH